MEEARGLDAMTSGCPPWKRFREAFHTLRLSHCLSANNSYCSSSGTGPEHRTSFPWKRNIVPSQVPWLK